jgi:hypothetical protein
MQFLVRASCLVRTRDHISAELSGDTRFSRSATTELRSTAARDKMLRIIRNKVRDAYFATVARPIDGVALGRVIVFRRG